jgi:hypothetical protein
MVRICSRKPPATPASDNNHHTNHTRIVVGVGIEWLTVVGGGEAEGVQNNRALTAAAAQTPLCKAPCPRSHL